ncbi:RNA-directed DNA polymerase (Reverse transcriptase) [Trifolium medium]|uniref:RNA-directed DNA polymerase (Reverse transcriptase) n=1 Tax=Trifolium medium TaxID=97028 RepID=A0A392M636_9FABA|nr:RNA-directed DNA polymerase (Reverse transcriptase) [Trifolium medium]
MNGLVANRKKCQFAQLSVEYLWHMISGAGVSVDPSCYRKFIKDYGKIAKSLTELTKKEGFQWNSKAQQAFESLK